MSVLARIVDKLRNYEYEKCDYEGVVGDIYVLIHHIADLEEENDDLRDSLQEQKAWEGRYWALLEEAEAARPRKIGGGPETQNMPDGTIVLDRCGCLWISSEGSWWRLVKDIVFGRLAWLPPLAAPHTIIHTPNKEES